MLIGESADLLISLFNYKDNKEIPKQTQKISGQTLILQFRLTEYDFTSLRPDYTKNIYSKRKQQFKSRHGKLKKGKWK
ncbi:hypothetical protein BS78_05G016100 [Paspalum vaginatum]|nr:hypothetical protein BS78_05G016100 [Paspalum vaginatum]